MTKKELINKLIEKNVSLNFGSGDYPVSISYNGDIDADLKALEPEIMKISRVEWEGVEVYLGGKKVEVLSAYFTDKLKHHFPDDNPEDLN